MNGFVAQVLAGTTATLAVFSGGMLFGWASPSLPKLLASDSDLPLTSDQSSWVVSFNSFGAIFGPIIVVLIVDRIGRKWTLILGAIPMVICWLMIGLATSYQWLYVARFIGGIGLGTVYSTAPMYMGEIAEDRIRGGLGALIYTMANMGMLYSFSIGPWVSRQMLALASAIPPVIFIIVFFWMPETPYYHLMKGKREAASSSLVWLRRSSEVEEELSNMKHSVESQRQSQTSITELLTNPGNRRAFLIPFGLFTFQQLSGVVAIESYASTIFELTGSSISSDVSVIIMGIVQTVCGLCVVFTVDITGRRPNLMFSTVGSFICLITEAVFFHLQENGQDTSGITWLPLAGILGFYITYTSGLGSLPYVIISEVFQTNVKAPATTVLSMYGSALGMIVSKLYQVVADSFGVHIVFYCFASCCVIGVIFIYFVLPETKGCSLQEIQDVLNRRTDSTDNICGHSK